MKDEALRQKRGVVVERGPVQEQQALLVYEDPGAIRPLEYLVAESRLAIPRERVAQARAAAALDAHTKTAIADALLGHQRPDLLRGGLGDFNHRYALGCACSATGFTPFASSCFFL